MKNPLVFIFVLALFSSCNKGDKKQTKYRIECTADNIENIQYTVRDEESAGYINNYNQPTWSKEWVGYNSNKIYVSFISGDQSGNIKLYVDDELVVDKYPVGLAEGVIVNFEN